jgi:hypothetical protein
MDRLTAIISRMMRPRQIKIERFAKTSEQVQHTQLKNILHTAMSTEYGKRYGFAHIRGYEGFAKAVNIHNYDNLKPAILRMMDGGKNYIWPSRTKWYAKSSGTTNDKSKFIPITREILKAHYKGGYDTVALYLKNNPESNFFAHKGFILGGSHDPSPSSWKTRTGDLSGILIQRLNPLINIFREPCKKIALMGKWEKKISAMVESTCKKDIGNLSGVPSWMLVFTKAMLEHTGCNNLTEVWPNLEVFFHGGIGFEPYRDQYRSIIPGGQMKYMEIYNASEGFFGIQDDPTDAAMMLMPDYGIFYEFIPATEVEADNPTVIPWEGVEKGRNYAIVITTTGGLWRYIIGDVIRFTSVFPHKFLIVGRTKHYINAFGEELIVDNADSSISLACRESKAVVKEYTVAPVFMLDRAQGVHQWLIEFEKLPESMKYFTEMLDKHLRSLNSDYDAKRYMNLALQPPKITIAPKDIFNEWLKAKGKLGGQHKVPRLSNDHKIMDELLALMQQRTS